MTFNALLRERSPEDERIFKLCDLVRETSFETHKFHKHGHLEKVYGNALAHRLKKLNITVEQQKSLPVFDEVKSTL